MNANALMPVVTIVAVFALIIFLGLKRRAKERREKHEGKPLRRIPKVIVGFWILLGISVIVLLIWSPKK